MFLRILLNGFPGLADVAKVVVLDGGGAEREEDKKTTSRLHDDSFTKRLARSRVCRYLQ